jgi:hypothetical protein
MFCKILEDFKETSLRQGYGSVSVIMGTFYFGIGKLLAYGAFDLKFLHILAVFNEAYPPRPRKSVKS